MAHTIFMTLLWFFSEPPKPPGEALLIVDLQQEKPKEQPKPTAQPTPEPTKAEPTATPPRVAQIPTPVPTAKQIEKKAQPKPTPPQAKPTPAKKAVAVKPQSTAMPTPEANEGKKPKTIIKPKPVEATPVKPEKKLERLAGLNRLPKEGDGAPKSPAKPKFDEEAGAAPGNLKPGEGKNDPNKRRRPTDDPFNKADAGGENDKPQTPLPQGLNTGRPDANRNDLTPGKLDNNLRGLGRPGGGSSGNFSPNPNNGSPNGVNPELAGTDGGGGANLPRRLAKRGGGGGSDAVFPVLDRQSDTAVAVNSAPGFSPGLSGGQGGGRGGGAGNNSGKGIGTLLAGADRGALNTKIGSGIGGGNGPGVGGPRGSGNGGEIAGGGGGSGGGNGGGNGSGYGAGKGGYGGGNGRGRGRVSGDPFGNPNGSGSGNPNGGGGKGGGPGGPGKGPLLAMGGGPGDGKGDGAGRGPGGRGAGGGTGPGRGAGGFGKGPGSGSGNGSGDGGKPGIGGGNGGGGRDGDAGGRGDGDAGNGTGLKGRPYRGRPGAQREIEGENSIGRGIWAPGFQIEFYQDTANHPDLPDATFNPGHPIDWKPFTQLVAKKTVPIINFNWGTNPPAKSMTYTFWSMKAVGRIFVPKDDTYEFYFDELDDAGRLYLDGKKIIDIWWVQKSTPASKGYFLKKGPHDLMIEYVQGPATEASIKLSWKSTSFPKEIIGVYKPND